MQSKFRPIPEWANRSDSTQQEPAHSGMIHLRFQQSPPYGTETSKLKLSPKP